MAESTLFQAIRFHVLPFQKQSTTFQVNGLKAGSGKWHMAHRRVASYCLSRALQFGACFTSSTMRLFHVSEQACTPPTVCALAAKVKKTTFFSAY